MIYTDPITGYEYTLPGGTDEITMQMHSDWSAAFGWDLFQRRNNTNNFIIQSAYQIFSFYSGVELEEAKQVAISSLIAACSSSGLFECLYEGRLSGSILEDFPEDYGFGANVWFIYLPADTHNPATMPLAEYQIVNQLRESFDLYRNGSWQDMLPVFAAYFRKDGEEFNIAYTQPGNERYEELKNLPMTIAFTVARFLDMNIGNQFNQILESYITANT